MFPLFTSESQTVKFEFLTRKITGKEHTLEVLGFERIFALEQR